MLMKSKFHKQCSAIHMLKELEIDIYRNIIDTHSISKNPVSFVMYINRLHIDFVNE